MARKRKAERDDTGEVEAFYDFGERLLREAFTPPLDRDRVSRTRFIDRRAGEELSPDALAVWDSLLRFPDVLQRNKLRTLLYVCLFAADVRRLVREARASGRATARNTERDAEIIRLHEEGLTFLAIKRRLQLKIGERAIRAAYDREKQRLRELEQMTLFTDF